jgi:large subunit ribosomal protein L6
MSKIGKKPISVPDGASVEITGAAVRVTGKNGEVFVPVLPYCAITVHETEGKKEVRVAADLSARQARANWGTMAALVNNAIKGVSAGFEKKLQLEGIGFKASAEGSAVVLSLGFSHPVRFSLPQGVSAAVEKNIITLKSADKMLLGKAAAEIRKLKKPEPYQGKGIRYVGETVRRKAGKKAAAAGAK